MSKLKKYNNFVNEDLAEFKAELDDKLKQQNANDPKQKSKIESKNKEDKEYTDIENNIKKTIEDLTKQKDEISKQLEYLEKTLTDPNIVTDVNKKKSAEEQKVKLQKEIDKFNKLITDAKQQQKDLTTKEK